MSEHTPRVSEELLTCDRLEAEDLHEVRCDECGRCGRDCKVWREDLEVFTTQVMERLGAPPEEARIVARVLVASDLRGIASHGVARLGRYISGIRAGYIRPGVAMDVQEPASTIGLIDARDGLGQVAGELGMNLAIRKAAEHGIGMVTVKNSNHYGIAGYYATMAVDKRMIGVSMTNAAPLVIPTHGADAILGTNPIAFGAPSARGLPFLLDTATSVVPRGKLEVYDRNRKQMPVGWAADENGYDCQNPGQVLGNLLSRAGGGILPLGGRGDQFGGHKGFGFAVMVDVLCGVLAGSAFGKDVNDLKRDVPEGQIATPRVGHFFMAIDPARFMPLDEFEARLDAFVSMLKDGKKALDQRTIFIHGEKEQVRSELHARYGIPVADNVFTALRRVAEELGIDAPATVAQRETEGAAS